jgi:peptidyl-prolyl cis-trans isomerase D
MIRFLQTPTQAKKYILGGLLLVVCVSMLFYLIPGFGDATTSRSGIYARVGDQEITSQQVEGEAQRMARQQGFPAGLEKFLVPSAANNLVIQAAMINEAHRMGLSVTDDELRDELQNGPMGQVLFANGSFIGQEGYQDFVQNNFHMGVEQFERLLKSDLLIRKLRTVIQSGVIVPEPELRDYFQKQNAKVKFDYAVLTTDEVTKQIKVTEPELKAYYEAHKQEYLNSVPEKRKARYVVVDTAKVSVPAPTEDDLKRYYAQHKDRFSVQERVNVRHILVKTPAPNADGQVDQKALDAAKAKAESLLKQLKGGANFEQLAKKNSDDTVSAKQGGSLGWIQHGATVPEFDKAAFALNQKGQLSDIVKSSYGFHIIQLEEKQPAHVRSFEEVKPEITPVVESEAKAKAAESEANAIAAGARTTGLNKAAADHHLEVVDSNFFAETDTLPGIGAAPEFMRAAFDAKPKTAPALARTQQGYVIFDVVDSKPASTPAFEEVRSRVETEFRTQQAQQMLTKKTQELSERARVLHDLKQAAKEQGATMKTSELVSAQNQVPDVGSMSGQAAVAFDMSKGQISGPIFNGRSGVVLTLVEKQEPSAVEFDKGKQLARETLLDRKRDEVLQIYAASLKQRMEKDGKIKYNKDEQERLTSRAGPAGS